METSEITIPSLIKGIEVIRKKRKICKHTLDESLDNMISTLQNEADEIDQFEDEENNQDKVDGKVKGVVDRVLRMKILDQIVLNHKKFYINLSKMTKYSDKALNKHINNLFPSNHHEKENLNKAIYQHFLYQKKSKITEAMKKEINDRYNLRLEKKLLRIHQIVEDLEKHNIDSAITWASEKESILEKMNSDLLFLLYQQKFVHLKTSSNKQTCIQFARETLPKFFTKYSLSIQMLMGSFLYDNPSENPRYSELYKPEKWKELSKKFFEDACRIYNIPSQSTLSTALEAGTLVLPQFLKYSLLSSRSLEEWDENHELPISIHLGKQYAFHSVFICPITKEKCNDQNPPVALECGHVISTMSLKKIFSHKKNRYKCPYCPTEISLTGSKKLYFE